MHWAKMMKQQIADWQETPGPFCACTESLWAKAMAAELIGSERNTTE
jgi:hypothetical protein